MFFKSLGCDGIDGAFQNIADSNGLLLEKAQNYNTIIGDCMGINLELPTTYNIYKGKYKVEFAYPNSDMEILNIPNLFSYAFIFGSRPKFPNFSYTFNLI